MGGQRGSVFTALATVVVAALALIACGDDEGSSGVGGGGSANGQPGATSMPDGQVYAGDLADGSALRVVLDVDPSVPTVAPFEEFREAVGGPEVTWIIAEIEVPPGADSTGRSIRFVIDGAGDDAHTANARLACGELAVWAASADDPAAGAAHARLLDGLCGGRTDQVKAPAGETTRYVLVYEGELPDFDHVVTGLGAKLEEV